jgi:hypothetical protein
MKLKSPTTKIYIIPKKQKSGDAKCFKKPILNTIANFIDVEPVIPALYAQ